MSATKALNSKTNIKQATRADLPVGLRQPVINRYAADSTAAQTVINFGFQVDTVGNPDAFILIVDGRILTPGAANDYTFTSVNSTGFTSQVTMTFPLLVGLNIQAIKMGLKKESELARAVMSVTTSGTLVPNTVNLVNTAAPRALSLPPAAQSRNTLITIKDASGTANTNNITITPAAGTIDGAGSLVINTAFGFSTLACDGTNWFKV